MFGLSRHPLSRVCHHSNPASDTSHRSWSIPVSTPSDSAVYPHENVCQPSSLQFKLRSNKTRLNWLQTVIDGQESRRALDKMSELQISGLDRNFCTRRSGSSQLTSGQHILEQSYTANQHGAWISCAGCALRLHHILRHTARMTSVSTPSSASVQEALKRMSLLRDNHFTAKAVRDTIADVEGRKPRKKKAPPQPTIVYNTVYNSGAASSATISSGTPVHRNLDAGLSKQIQSVLDAAVVDRCDFVEICCSDVPAQTASETTTHRYVRSSLAGFLRNDLGRHGSHLLWLRIRIIRHVAVFEPDRLFESFSSMRQQSCNLVAAFIGNGLQSVPAGLLASCVILELSRKVVVESFL